MSETIRNIKLVHQILSIADIDFENESLYGHTELTLIANKNISDPENPIDIKTISLNCKQCKIFCVVFNGTYDTQDFEYCDPLLIKPCNDETKRDLQSLLYQDEYGRLSVDADEGNGEISINVPENIQELLKQGLQIKLAIEFCLEKPSGGIRFVTDRGYEESNLNKNSYLYTIDNQSSLWFPCVQSYNECCTWKLEIICNEDLEVLASGNLIETEIINLNKDNNDTNISMNDTNMSHYNRSRRNMKKFHYFLGQPTCAPNIGLCIGRFESIIDSNISELSYHGEPELIGLVKNTTGFISDVFDFYEDLLSVHLPYKSYKMAFCYDIPDECIHYSGLSILNVNLLTTKSIIEQTMVTRRVLAHACARQFFGCFISMYDWHSWWLVIGLAEFISCLYMKKMMGNNEYKQIIYQDMKDVCAYEREQGYILLDLNFSELTSKDNINKCHILLKNPISASISYMRVAKKKANLVMKLIDDTLGREIMTQLMNKILSQGIDTPKKFTELNCWSSINLSTDTFTQLLASFCSKDINFLLENWVSRSGCARFNVSFTFNRKKNTVEIELKQDIAQNQKGFRKYVGPITIIIQEIDGSFAHNLHVEDNASCKFDISLHSKGKKSKKKKIPLITGEEVDIDTSQMDNDSPILWIRVDPELKILREVKLEQPDHHWQHQLKHERDITAQLDAIDILPKFPTTQTRSTLISTIENTECYFRIRTQACYALAECANKMVHTWNGPLPLISTFKKFFYTTTNSENVVISNNFSDLQMYFLEKSLPIAMGSVRNTNNLCPPEVVRFLLYLIKLNENSKNSYSDGYYKSALIDGLANTISPSITSQQNIETSKNLSTEMKLFCEEICLRLNLEKIIPSYHYEITKSCLRGLRKLQKMGHIPEDLTIFKKYASNKRNFDGVRMCAYEILVDFLNLRTDEDLIEYLFDSIENDHSYEVKYHIITILCRNAPFKVTNEESSKGEFLVNKLWALMNKYRLNYRMKSALGKLYQLLHGFGKPKCLRQVMKPFNETIEAVNLF